MVWAQLLTVARDLCCHAAGEAHFFSFSGQHLQDPASFPPVVLGCTLQGHLPRPMQLPSSQVADIRVRPLGDGFVWEAPAKDHAQLRQQLPVHLLASLGWSCDLVQLTAAFDSGCQAPVPLLAGGSEVQNIKPLSPEWPLAPASAVPAQMAQSQEHAPPTCFLAPASPALHFLPPCPDSKADTRASRHSLLHVRPTARLTALPAHLVARCTVSSLLSWRS